MAEPIKIKLGLHNPTLYDYRGELELNAQLEIKRHSCPNCKWTTVRVVGIYPSDTGTLYRCIREQ